MFAIILGMLLPFARESTVDIRGMLYLDGRPSGTAEIHLLETNTTPNRYVLEEHHKGHFEFRDVIGAKGDVRLSIDLPGYEEKVVTCPHKSGDVLRVELSTRDMKSVIATEGKLDVFPTGIELPAVDDTSDTQLKTICVHNFINTTGQPQYDELGAAIAANIAARLEDAPGVQVAGRATLSNVMRKLGLQKSEPMDEEVARMLGKLVGTNFSLVGSFQQIDMIEVSARLVSNETGRELSNTSKTSRDRNYLAAAIAFEIAHSIGSSLPKPLAELASSQPLDPTAADEALRLFDAGDYAGAFYAYSRVSDADLSNIYLHRSIEKSARLAGLEREFLSRYQRLAHQYPDKAMLRNYLGNAYLMSDPKDTTGKAREQYEEALHLDPDLALPLNNLGIIDSRQSNLTGAEKWFEQYLGASPEDAVGWVNFGILHRSMFERDRSNSEALARAERDFQKAIGIQPGLASAYKHLGKLLEATDRKAEALNAYQHSLMLDHDQPELLQKVEELQRELVNLETSPSEFDDMQTRAGIRNGAILELTDQVIRAIDEQNLQKAEVMAAELCRAMPTNALAYRLLGRVYELQGREEEARRAFAEANRLESIKKRRP